MRVLMFAMRVLVRAVRMPVLFMRMTTESMRMAVPLPAALLDDIVEAEKHQCAASDPWEPAPDLVVEGDPKPGNEKSEGRGKENVTAAGEGRNQKGLRAIPFLDTRGQHKRQPMRRDGGVEKRHGEASDDYRRKDCLVH